MKKYFHAKRVKQKPDNKKLYSHQSLEILKESTYITNHNLKKSLHFSSICNTSLKVSQQQF